MSQQTVVSTPAQPATLSPNYKWYVLALGALTFTLVMGMPSMSLTVLFYEIQADLGLTLVQVGVIWGIGSLTGIFMGIVGGALGDRFGAKRTIMVACLLMGILGGLRAFAPSFFALAGISVLFGAAATTIPTNVHKSCGIWFSGRRLGMANGVVSTGMALGFTLGALLAASVLSPLLGGWRNLFLAYGVVALVFGGIWAVTRPGPVKLDAAATRMNQIPLRSGLAHVVRVRNIWLLGLTMLGIGGCVQGTLGYLPLYLQDVGWTPAAAGSALALFNGVSMVCTIPIAMLSDRIGSRRAVLMVAALMTTAGVGMLAFATGALVWFAVVVAGMVRDGFMAVLMTQIIELRGIGVLYAGVAAGTVMAFSSIAGVFSPALGNSLADYAPGLPFLFWAGLGLVGVLGLYLLRE